jgi:ABC-type transporter Mla subunit MlaD
LEAAGNGRGLGQIGDIDHNLNEALSGRQDAVRDLIARLDTFVGTLYQQRDNIIATIDELNRFSATLGSQQEVLTRALNKIPPALDVLIKERLGITTALEKLGTFSETAPAYRRCADRPRENPQNLHRLQALRTSALDRHRTCLHPDVPADGTHRPWRPR